MPIVAFGLLWAGAVGGLWVADALGIADWVGLAAGLVAGLAVIAVLWERASGP